ncbi:MAG: arginase family protein [Bacteroidota bacterium]
MSRFHFYTKKELLDHTRIRRYETKLGERAQILKNGLSSLSAHPEARFVCIGVPECIGVLGDHGTKGAEHTWFHFVNAFLNLQSSDACSGSEVILAGYFDFSDVQQVIDHHHMNTEEKIDACRHAVANIIDEEVESVVKAIIASGKIPIVVGGGHNNAYPIIKSAAKNLYKAGKTKRPMINAINLSSFGGYRIMEGRHNGNAIRYAMEESYLHRYAVIGLQENSNPQSMMDDLYSNVNIHYHTYEEIFVDERLNFVQSLAQSFAFIDDEPIAVDLDLDAVNHPGSMSTHPGGVSVDQARQFIRFCGNYSNICSLHICKGSSGQLHAESQQLATLIGLLITDFVKSKI